MAGVRHFTADILSRMQSTQNGAMQDRCYVLAYSSAQDDHGNPTPTYTAGSLMYCGFQPARPTEKQGSGDVPVIDAHLRLSLGVTIDERDRIAIYSRYGVTLDNLQVFEIHGPVKRGPSGLVLELVIVDDGTGGNIG